MKIISVIFILFISLFSFSQENICLEKDSIFNDLKARRHSDSLSIVAELNKLKTTYFNEKHNDTLIYFIGRIYYEDFILPYKKNQPRAHRYLHQPERNIYDSISFVLKEKYFKKSFFENSADSALFYFKKIESIDSERKKALFFVIKQLECFVNSDFSYVDLSSLVSPTDYIPFWYLANLSENWKYDKSKDYLRLILTSLMNTPDGQSSLSYMNEPSLFQMNLPKNSEIFRLTYEPSFHNDICIRFEKNEDKVILFWKEGRKKKGRRLGIKHEGKKEISLKTWQYFIKLIDDFNFLNLPNNAENIPEYAMICDGASWFLEYKTNSTYKAHYNRIPDRDIEILSLFLLELSGVKYKTDKWEPMYFRYDLVLTKDDKYIITEDIEDTLIDCLNQHIDKDIKKYKCCCYFDSYLKFNRKGRIKIVRYPEDENCFLDKWWGFQDRRCRKEMKKALRNIDFSYLKLKKPIYYYLKVCYDKETHIFKKEINNCH